ncbi:histone-lysine N-methyltransferase SETMAR [Trichonephila clavipes]|uniref:Histone-lysine N-methyltransferase SETMAR n=1 Tax=Trichonephila clavipes TaxID=2585209 RepID=A0A8X6RQE8_TRICX|nr:histone-lysine N-methyltransferase SETMAR [Trichonephila clavipes]
MHGVCGADTITANYVQFWFRRFRSGIFDVKDAPHTGSPVVENVDKITEIVEVDWHKRPELTNRRRVVFHQDNARPHMSPETLGACLGSFNASTI